MDSCCVSYFGDTYCSYDREPEKPRLHSHWCLCLPFAVNSDLCSCCSGDADASQVRGILAWDGAEISFYFL